MAKIFYSVTDAQAEKFRNHCKNLSGQLSEQPGYSFRRILHAINAALDSGLDLDEIKSGCQFLIDLKDAGCCFKCCKKHVEEIADIINEDTS